MPRLVLIVAAAGLALALAGWRPGVASPPLERTAASPAPATAEMSLRRGGGPMAPGCGVAEAEAVVVAFLDAYNRGDAAALTAVLPTVAAYPYADRPGFQWFSVTDRTGHFVTYDPADLPAYAAARHRQRERLVLVRLELAARQPSGADFTFRLARRADDRAPHEMIGKGTLDCATGTIVAWSMDEAGLSARPEATPPAPPTAN